ncbi:MAG: recombinase family protein [Burkholderiales bacterium]
MQQPRWKRTQQEGTGFEEDSKCGRSREQRPTEAPERVSHNRSQLRAAIYARYSTDKQNATSLEDQIREARALALREGFVVADDLIFTDAAASGHANASQRTGYRRLLDAWDAGLIDIVVAHELSRLTRDFFTGAELWRRVKSTGVNIVTADGIDTRREPWETLLMMRLAMAGEEGRSTSQRVARTMEGLLLRGGMIGPPAFGYRVDWSQPPSREHPGVRWAIDDAKAAIVRDIFRRRKSGLSVAQIARWLNTTGVAPARVGRKGPGFWRPASVHRMLSNSIYRGVARYHGSPFTKAKFRRMRQTPTIVEFSREHLRLVSDETWQACNPPRKQRLRGGVRHVLSGLLVCGDCEARLSVAGWASNQTLHCPGCEQAVRVGSKADFIGYTSVTAVNRALHAALQEILQGSVLKEFRCRLRARLTAGPNEAEQHARTEVRRLTMESKRLVHMARTVAVENEVLSEELHAVSLQLSRARARVDALERLQTSVSKASVERQLSADVGPLIGRLLRGEPAPHEVRAVLRRLIPHFALVARPKRGCSVFDLSLAPGVLAAECTGESPADSVEVKLRITVSTTARRPTQWNIEVERH